MSVAQITKACTLSCSYCFDKVWQNEVKWKQVTMDDKTFDKYLSRMGEFFQSKPEEKNICISWWEPTIHPQFTNFINKSIHSWFSIYLLSNFTFWNDKAKFLKKFFENWKLSSMVNVNSPYSNYAWMNKWLWTRTLMNLKYLENPNIRLSFNIFDPDENHDFIFEVLKKYPNLDKTIRLGVVNPIISDLRKDETYVFDKNNIIPSKNESTWSFYKRLWKVTDNLVEKLTKLWYSIYLDCWVGWCIFKPETISMIKNNWWQTHWCSLPNDEVWINWKYSSCYTLYDYWNEDWKLNLENHSIKKSRWKFILKTEFFKEHYLILPKCVRCPLLEKGCPRFCVSNNVYYYEKLFKQWFENLIEDEYYSKLTNQEKEFTKFEYFLSIWRLDIVKKLIDESIFKDLLKKWEYNSIVSIRFYMYYILYNFLNENLSRWECLDYIWKVMTEVSNQKIKFNDKDFKLIKIVEILIKEYKKV